MLLAEGELTPGGKLRMQRTQCRGEGIKMSGVPPGRNICFPQGESMGLLEAHGRVGENLEGSTSSHVAFWLGELQ